MTGTNLPTAIPMRIGSPYFLAAAVAKSKVVPALMSLPKSSPGNDTAHTAIVSIDPDSPVPVVFGVGDDGVPFSC